MSSDFISCVPDPDGAVEEAGLQYPWQTPARWTYPTLEEVEGMRTERMSKAGVMAAGMRKEPNEGTGGIPDVASEECLKRATVPWTQKKGTKVYLKVSLLLFFSFAFLPLLLLSSIAVYSRDSQWSDIDNRRPTTTKTIQVNTSLSNMCTNPLLRTIPAGYLVDCSIGPGGPVTMDGEISVVPAKDGSREVKRNEIGVEFKITLSGEELFEAVYMRKVGNGTVVLEVMSLCSFFTSPFPILSRFIAISIPSRSQHLPHIFTSHFLIVVSAVRDTDPRPTAEHMRTKTIVWKFILSSQFPLLLLSPL